MLESCRLGLHRHTRELLDRTRQLVAEDGSFASLVRAVEQILVLHVSRAARGPSPRGVLDLADAAYERACYLIPGLAGTPRPRSERSWMR